MSGWFRTRGGGLIICARCGCPAPVDTLSMLQYESNFCPKCGKRMNTEEDGKEKKHEDRLET